MYPSPPTRPALTSPLHKTKKLRKVKQKLNQKPSVLYFIFHNSLHSLDSTSDHDHSLTLTMCAMYGLRYGLVVIILQYNEWLNASLAAENFHFLQIAN